MPRSARLYKGCVTGHRGTDPFGDIGVDWILGENTCRRRRRCHPRHHRYQQYNSNTYREGGCDLLGGRECITGAGGRGEGSGRGGGDGGRRMGDGRVRRVCVCGGIIISIAILTQACSKDYPGQPGCTRQAQLPWITGLVSTR